MKEVSIYIATSIHGRWNRDGYIGYCLEYYKDGSKYPNTLTDYERVEDLNENRAEQQALIRAISRIREKCVLSIYTESEYLYKGFCEDGNVEKWIKAGWKTTRNTEVKNRDKWQELMRLLQGNMYKFYLKETNAYVTGLQADLRRLEAGEITLDALRGKRKEKRDV